MTENEKRYLEVLMEEMNGKFSLVLEGHDAIRREFNEQLTEVRQKQDMFESLLKVSHDELKEEIQGVRTELKEEVQGVRTELKEEIQGVRTELKEEIQGVRTELKEEIQGVDKRLTSEIRIVGQKVDGHEDRIRFLERKTA